MSSITALALECDYDTLSGETDGHDQIQGTEEVLPGLRIMSYTGGSFCANLLAHRPIERPCVLGQAPRRLHGLISRSPGNLSHLFMFNFVEFLRSASTMDLAPYRHLRYVGTITFKVNAVGSLCIEMNWWLTIAQEYIASDMDTFKPLRNLAVMEINRMTLACLKRFGGSTVHPKFFFGPTPLFFKLLARQHPLLRRVLVATRSVGYAPLQYPPNPVLWEKTDGWNPRTVPHLEYWGILQGKMDDIGSGGCDSQFVNGNPHSIYSTPRSFYGSPLCSLNSAA